MSEITAKDDLDLALEKHHPAFVLKNVRRLLAVRYRNTPNWAIAMEVYGLGSTYAHWLCQKYGVAPDAITVSINTPSSPIRAGEETA